MQLTIWNLPKTAHKMSSSLYNLLVNNWSKYRGYPFIACPMHLIPDPVPRDEKIVKALIDFESEVNMMTSAYIAKLGLVIWKVNISTQKINGSALATYEIIIAGFFLPDKLKKVLFFKLSAQAASFVAKSAFSVSSTPQ